MTISCSNAKHQSTPYLDGQLRSGEHAAVTEHLAQCGDCSSHFEEVAVTSSALGRLAAPQVPPELQTRLQVLASHERKRVLESKGSRFDAFWSRWKFRINQLMRPLALPATGGLLSAILLFGTFVFMIGTNTRIASYDIPLCGDGEPNLVPIDMHTNQLVVLNMTLNRTGRLGDYALSEPPRNVTADLRSHLGSITIPNMPTVFALEQPISGDIQIRLIPLGFRQ